MAKRDDDEPPKKSSGRSSKESGKSSGKSPKQSGSSSKSSGKSPKQSGKVSKRAPEPEDDGDFEDEVDVDDPAADLLDSAVKKTPWWAISLAFHGLDPRVPPARSSSPRRSSRRTRRPSRSRSSRSRSRRSTSATSRAASSRRPACPAPRSPSPTSPAIFFPGAEESDHNESNDGEDYGQMKGDSKDALSFIPGTEGGVKGRQPGKGPGVNDSIGVGGGSGGSSRYGGRFGGRRNLVARGGGSIATESAVEAGLHWLARHQAPDGHWYGEDYAKQCKNGDCTGTGVSRLRRRASRASRSSRSSAPATRRRTARATSTPVTGQTMRFGDVVRKGLKWLIDQQNAATGAIGPSVGEMMYNHCDLPRSL